MESVTYMGQSLVHSLVQFATESSLGQLWVVALLHLLWQGTLIALFYAAFLRASARRTASERYLVAVASLLAMAACPLVTMGVLAGNRWQEKGRVVEVAGVSRMQATEGTQAIEGTQGTPVAEGSYQLHDSQPSHQSPSPPLSLSRGLLLAWFSGVGLLSFRLALGGWILHGIRRRSQSLGPHVQPLLDKIVQRFGVAADVLIASTGQVSSAMVSGVIRPIVLIPTSWLLELSPEMLEAVLAHEIAHVLRRDLWMNLVQRIVETLFFFHPAIWWMSDCIRCEREKCCDELAVSVLPSRAAYARTLNHLARVRIAGSAPPLLSAGFGGKRMFLLNRVKHILGYQTTSIAWSPWTSLAALACIGLISGGTIVCQSATGQEKSADSKVEVGVDVPSVPLAIEELQEANTELHKQTLMLQETVNELQGQLQAAHNQLAEQRAMMEALMAQQQAADVAPQASSGSPVPPMHPVAPLAPLAPLSPIAPLAPLAPIAPLAPLAPETLDPEEIQDLERDAYRSSVDAYRSAQKAHEEARYAARDIERSAAHALTQRKKIEDEIRALTKRSQDLAQRRDQEQSREMQSIAGQQEELARQFALRREAAKLKMQRDQLAKKRELRKMEARVDLLKRRFKDAKDSSISPEQRDELEEAEVAMQAEREAFEEDAHLAEKMHQLEAEAQAAEVAEQASAMKSDVERRLKGRFEAEMAKIRGAQEELRRVREQMEKDRHQKNSKRDYDDGV